MAKRRRIDIKFIVIAAMLLVGAGGVGFVLMKTVFKPNPQKYLTLAQQDMAREDWDSAVKNLSTAIKYSRAPDPGPWLMYADALNHQMAKDPNEVGNQWRGALNQALSIDPSNKEALRRLLDYHLDLVLLLQMHQSGYYDAISKYATKLAAVDPSDKRAQFALCFSVLDQWLNGIQTDAKQVEDAEAKLTELAKTDPNSTEVPTLLGRIKMNRAWEAQRQG